MASPNINLRDPVLYRIVHAAHPRTGDAWCIYPTYDFAHGQSDAIEGVTHSICTLEFEVHRPLYDWLIEHLPVPAVPHQYEFARLNLTHTVLSKRVLLRLVNEGHVRGWDDPRMPTICRAAAARLPGRGDPRVRDHGRRVQGGLGDRVRPARVRGAPGAQPDGRAAVRRARPAQGGDHQLARGRDRADGGGQQPRGPVGRHARRWRSGASCGSSATTSWRTPVPKFFRLSPGREVRLRNAFFITCQEVVKDDAGRVVELRCTYDPATRGGSAPDGRKVKATLHWVSAAHAVPAEVRLYDQLFSRPDPGASDDLFAELNPASETIVSGAMLEPSLAETPLGETVQFERLGYFTPDTDSAPGALVFNRTLTLKDTWAKVQARG